MKICHDFFIFLFVLSLSLSKSFFVHVSLVYIIRQRMLSMAIFN